MSNRLHGLAGLLATACIATFLLSTLVVEGVGSPQAVATVKAVIVTPGLWLLVPAMAAVGASGLRLARAGGGPVTLAKARRMRLIAANGLLVLVPCALLLARWAAAGNFGAAFYALQAAELVAGATNLVLMLRNLGEGLRLARRRRAAAARSSAA